LHLKPDRLHGNLVVERQNLKAALAALFGSARGGSTPTSSVSLHHQDPPGCITLEHVTEPRRFGLPSLFPGSFCPSIGLDSTPCDSWTAEAKSKQAAKRTIRESSWLVGSIARAAEAISVTTAHERDITLQNSIRTLMKRMANRTRRAILMQPSTEVSKGEFRPTRFARLLILQLMSRPVSAMFDRGVEIDAVPARDLVGGNHGGNPGLYRAKGAALDARHLHITGHGVAGHAEMMFER
jgi:hypothetical protein